MTKKLMTILATLAIACALCFALISCESADNKANFVGTWQAETLEFYDGTIYNLTNNTATTADGTTVDHDNSDRARSITLNQNGTGSTSRNGYKYDMTWVADSATQIIVTYKNEAFGISRDEVYTLRDGKLIEELDKDEIYGDSGLKEVIYIKE